MPQFVESSEHRYHECLCVVPALLTDVRRVFIGGGGDGLGAARLLQLEAVERVVVCDYDPAMTELASTHSELVRLNGGSLRDPRVDVRNDDAVRALDETDEQFDLIVLDFPDPYFPELGRLYTRAFYERVSRRLAPGGVMVTQTLATPQVTRIVRATVRAVFPHEGYYCLYPGVGFTVGSHAPLALRHPVPVWTRFLSPDLMAALFAHPRDRASSIDPTGASPNEADGLAVVEATLLDEILPMLAGPHAYRPDTVEVYLTPETIDAADVTVEQIRCLLAALARRPGVALLAVESRLARTHRADLLALGYRPLDKVYQHYRLALTDHTSSRLRRLWRRLDDGSVTALESTDCRPSEHPEIGRLLEDYLGQFGHRFFDMPSSHFDMLRRARFVITRDESGRPLSFARLLEHEEALEIELFQGLGTPRQNLMSIVLLLTYLTRCEVETVECYAPDGVFGQGIRRLGAIMVETIELFFAQTST